MSDEESVGPADDERRGRVDRRTTIDLTRAERGEPERRRLPGVDRRDNDDSLGTVRDAGQDTDRSADRDG